MEYLAEPRLLLPRESGDGAELLTTTTTTTVNLAGAPRPISHDKPTSPAHLKRRSKKLERITKNIQDTWLKKNLNTKSRVSCRFLDLKQRSTVVLPASLPPKGRKLILITPRQIKKDNPKTPNKNSDPKFIPYEPYKAATAPMHKKQKPQTPKKKKDVDLNVLVRQMSTVKLAELGQEKKVAVLQQNELEVQRQNYEKQLVDLQKQKDYIEGQLKFQAQVNSELKGLLVSAVSVGDENFVTDKITSMTEDKLHLAERLLNTAEDLSNRTEMIEFYTGQIEVWRSKFLSTSVMVEELARWKTTLANRNNLLLKSNKKLLETVARLRESQVEVLINLAFLDGRQNLKLESANALELAKENLSISQNLSLKHNQLGMPRVINLQGLDTLTEAEKLAVQAMETTKEPLISTDELLKAVMGQSLYNMGRGGNDREVFQKKSPEAKTDGGNDSKN